MSLLFNMLSMLVIAFPSSKNLLISWLQSPSAVILKPKKINSVIVSPSNRRSQDGGGIGQGDHFLSYKFIGRTIQHRANFTKQLLIASSGHQAPRKAAHYLRREVGQNIKDKKRDKRARDEDPSREGSLNRGSFQSPGNPRTGGSGGSFRISEGNLTGRKINK